MTSAFPIFTLWQFCQFKYSVMMNFFAELNIRSSECFCGSFDWPRFRLIGPHREGEYIIVLGWQSIFLENTRVRENISGLHVKFVCQLFAEPGKGFSCQNLQSLVNSC